MYFCILNCLFCSWMRICEELFCSWGKERKICGMICPWHHFIPHSWTDHFFALWTYFLSRPVFCCLLSAYLMCRVSPLCRLKCVLNHGGVQQNDLTTKMLPALLHFWCSKPWRLNTGEFHSSLWTCCKRTALNVHADSLFLNAWVSCLCLLLCVWCTGPGRLRAHPGQPERWKGRFGGLLDEKRFGRIE